MPRRHTGDWTTFIYIGFQQNLTQLLLIQLQLVNPLHIRAHYLKPSQLVLFVLDFKCADAHEELAANASADRMIGIALPWLAPSGLIDAHKACQGGRLLKQVCNICRA